MGLDPQPAGEFKNLDLNRSQSNLQSIHGKSYPKAVFVLQPEHPGLALVVADNEALVKEEHLLLLNVFLSGHLG